MAEAYIRGLERRLEEGKSVDINSVASFFVSRVDTEVDKRLEAHRPRRAARQGRHRQRARRLPALRGDLPRRALRRPARRRRRRAAPAVGLDRRQEPGLPRRDVRRGARRARTPSTRCRWPRCWPPATTPRSAAPTAGEDPAPVLKALADAGIDMVDVTDQLLREGVDKFVEPMEKLLEGIDAKREAIVTQRPPSIDASLPDEDVEPRVAERVEQAAEEDVARRIWRKDDTLWGPAGQPEVANRLGWLTVAEQMREELDDLQAFAAGRARRGRQGRRPAGHGRLVAGARGHPALVRRAGRLAEPARARLHRRRRGAQRRDGHRPRPRAVPRLHEVGRDDRDAVAVQALLVAAAGRQRVRRHHRPGLRAWRSSRASTASGAPSSTTPTSAGATARCRSSASCPRRSWAPTWPGMLHAAGVAEHNCQSFESGDVSSGLWLGLALGRAGRRPAATS